MMRKRSTSAAPWAAALEIAFLEMRQPHLIQVHHRGGHQVGFGIKVVQHSAPRHARQLDDGADRGTGVTMFVKRRERRI